MTIPCPYCGRPHTDPIATPSDGCSGPRMVSDAIAAAMKQRGVTALPAITPEAARRIANQMLGDGVARFREFVHRLPPACST